MSLHSVFLQIMNMSLTAGMVIMFILLLRQFIKKMPKVFSYILWAVVLFRLICPVSVSSNVSLLGLFDTPTIEFDGITNSVEYVTSDIIYTEYREVNDNVDPYASNISEAVSDDHVQGKVQTADDLSIDPATIITYTWLFGIFAMAGYSAISYFKLRRKLAGVIKLRDNIYLADHIESAFVMGLVRPKIYLPSSLSETEQRYIILHEQHHIHRFDHVMKFVAFIALCVHWFNPLVWVAFIQSSKDMEMSCDEAVIKKMGEDIRAEYSASLLSLVIGRRIIAGTPLAFSEGNAKKRIKNLARWKKPTAWATVIVAVLCITITVVCAVDPIDDVDAGSDVQPYSDMDSTYLLFNGARYVSSYMHENIIPSHYSQNGYITTLMTNDADLVGNSYYTSQFDDMIYVYQKCGIPVSEADVDDTNPQWAFVSWVLEDATENDLFIDSIYQFTSNIAVTDIESNKMMFLGSARGENYLSDDKLNEFVNILNKVPKSSISQGNIMIDAVMLELDCGESKYKFMHGGADGVLLIFDEATAAMYGSKSWIIHNDALNDFFEELVTLHNDEYGHVSINLSTGNFTTTTEEIWRYRFYTTTSKIVVTINDRIDYPGELWFNGPGSTTGVEIEDASKSFLFSNITDQSLGSIIDCVDLNWNSVIVSDNVTDNDVPLSETTVIDLSDGEFTTTAEEIDQYSFRVSTGQISVTVHNSVGFDGEVVVWTAQTDDYVRRTEMDEDSNSYVFTDLIPCRYQIGCEDLSGCTITVREV